MASRDPVELQLERERNGLGRSDPVSSIVSVYRAEKRGVPVKEAVKEEKVERLEEKRDSYIFDCVKNFAESDVGRPLSIREREVLKMLLANSGNVKLTAEQKEALENLGGPAGAEELLERAKLEAQPKLESYTTQIEAAERGREKARETARLEEVAGKVKLPEKKGRPQKMKARIGFFSESERKASFGQGPYETKAKQYFSEDEIAELSEDAAESLREALGEEVETIDEVRWRLAALASLASEEFKKYHSTLTEEGKKRIVKVSNYKKQVEKIASSLAGKKLEKRDEVTAQISAVKEQYSSVLNSVSQLKGAGHPIEKLAAMAEKSAKGLPLSKKDKKELKMALQHSTQKAMENAVGDMVAEHALPMLNKAKSALEKLESGLKNKLSVGEQIELIREARESYHGNLGGLVEDEKMEAAVGPIDEAINYLEQVKEWNDSYRSKILEIKSKIRIKPDEGFQEWLQKEREEGSADIDPEVYGPQLAKLAKHFESEVKDVFTESVEENRKDRELLQRIGRAREKMEELSEDAKENYSSWGATSDQAGKRLVGRFHGLEDGLIMTLFEVNPQLSETFNQMMEGGGPQKGALLELEEERELLDSAMRLSEEQKFKSFVGSAAEILSKPYRAVFEKAEELLQSEIQGRKSALLDVMAKYGDALEKETERRNKKNYAPELELDKRGRLEDASKLSEHAFDSVMKGGRLEILKRLKSAAEKRSDDDPYAKAFKKNEKEAVEGLLEPAVSLLSERVKNLDKMLKQYPAALKEIEDSEAQPDLISLYGELVEKYGEDLLPLTARSVALFVEEEAETLSPLNNAFGTRSRGMFTLAIWKGLGGEKIKRVREAIAGEKSRDFSYLLDKIKDEMASDYDLSPEEEELVSLAIPRVAPVDAETLPESVKSTEIIFSTLYNDFEEVGKEYKKAGKEYLELKSGLKSASNCDEETAGRAVKTLKALGVLKEAEDTIEIQEALFSVEGSMRLPDLDASEAYEFTDKYAALHEKFSGSVEEMSRGVEGLKSCVREMRPLQSTPEEYRRLLKERVDKHVYSLAE